MAPDRGLGPQLLGDAEVHQPHDAELVLHQVRGLQVAMHDAHVVDRLQTLRPRGCTRRRPAPAASGPLSDQHLAQVDALDVLHRDVAQPAFIAVLVDAADVAVAHLAREADLGPEAALHVGVVAHVGAQHLDRDRLLELVVAGLVHHAHAALAERRQDLEAAGDERAADQGLRGAQGVAAVEAQIGRIRDVGLTLRALHGRTLDPTETPRFYPESPAFFREPKWPFLRV